MLLVLLTAAKKLVEGDLKFTIELCKTLILHYHCTFGNGPKSSCMPFAHKKRLLLWLHLVIPEFTADDLIPYDWTDGTFLSSLLHYCLCQDSPMAKSSELSNISHQASKDLDIPTILEQSYLTSGNAEFILMMYLYYFVIAGQKVLLQWVNKYPGRKNAPANDFHHGWSDGHLVYETVYDIIPQFMASLEDLTCSDAAEITELAITEAKRNLHVSSHYSASDIADSANDPLPLILFLTQLQSASLQSPSSKSYPPSKSSAVFIRKDLNPLQRVGSRVSIEVDSQGSPDTILQAVVQGNNVSSMMESAQGSEKGTTTFFFVPKQVGHFIINITCNGHEILESPIDLDVYDPDKCVVVSTLEKEYLLNQPITLTISTSKAGKGELTASLDTTYAGDTTTSPALPHAASFLPNVMINKMDNRLYQVSFTPQIQGIYNLSLSFNNVLLRIIKFDCKHIVLKGRFVNNSSTIKLDSFFNKNVHVSVSDPQKNVVPVNLMSACTYSYTPLLPGNYSISVLIDGHPLRGSPFTEFFCYDIYVREYPTDCCFVNEPITTIVAADESVGSKVGKENFNVVLSFQDGQTKERLPDRVVSMKYHDEKNVFAFIFTPEKAGQYLLSLAYNGISLPSPDDKLEFDVKSQFTLRKSSVPPYLRNKPITAILEVNDHELSVDMKKIQLLGDEQADLQVNTLENNVFTVKFTPRIIGEYKLNLSIGDKAVPDSLMYNISDPKLSLQELSHDDTNCLVQANLQLEGATLEGFKVQPVVTSDQSPSTQHALEGSNFGVIAVGEKTKRIYPTINQHQEDQYSIHFGTNVADVYMLYVCYNGELLSCCPCSIDVNPKVEVFDHVIPFEADISSPVELLFSITHAQKISTRDFTVRVASKATNSAVSPNLVEEEPGLFRVSFLPRGDDTFSIDISWYSLPITSSPILITYKQRTYGPPVAINFQPNMGSRVSVSATVEDAETDNPELPLPQVAVQQYKRGCYEISLLRCQRKKYCLHVFCSGDEIDGSPMLVDATQLPASSVSNADELTSFHISDTDVFSVSVRVLKDQRKVIPDLKKATPELVTIQFKDRERHVYDLRLYWNDSLVKGAPFILAKHSRNN